MSATAEAGLKSLSDEITLDDLPVRGELPGWLSGSLLRTGPATWEIGADRLRHLFDGLAMLHRFTLSGGQVSYAGRYLESRSYRAARRQGGLASREFATDPCRSIFQRVQSLFAATTDNANVNIATLGDRFLAMTETALPVEFDQRTLEVAGVPYRAPGQLSTAHPHRDRDTGAMLNYAAKLGVRSGYRFFRVDPETARTEVVAALPVREPAYMHSFGLTERWFVLAEFPLVVNPVSIPLSGRPFIENFQWKPERGTRITLVDRRTGEPGKTVVTDPVFAFHHVNAYEDGDEVVVDVCAYDDPQIIKDLYLDRLRGLMREPAGADAVQRSWLTRFRLSGDGSVTTERLSEAPVELPRFNTERCQERPYRYVWGIGPGSGWFDHLVKIDIADGTTVTWRDTDGFVAEPVFVPRPGGDAEDDGAVLTIVLDAARETSFLLVLDAASLKELARAEVPHHIPYHFHGGFVPSGA
jgi:beta,beta-carotene 9',10'-dioxygenase